MSAHTNWILSQLQGKVGKSKALKPSLALFWRYILYVSVDNLSKKICNDIFWIGNDPLPTISLKLHLLLVCLQLFLVRVRVAGAGLGPDVWRTAAQYPTKATFGILRAILSFQSLDHNWTENIPAKTDVQRASHINVSRIWNIYLWPPVQCTCSLFPVFFLLYCLISCRFLGRFWRRSWDQRWQVWSVHHKGRWGAVFRGLKIVNPLKKFSSAKCPERLRAGAALWTKWPKSSGHPGRAGL